MKKMEKQIIINPKIKSILPHEISTALTLAEAGYKVEFTTTNSNIKTADAYIDGQRFEFKSPEGAKIRSIEHILKKAEKQSPRIVLDSARTKKLQDKNIYSFLLKWVNSSRTIASRIIFINKNRGVVDIKRKVR